MKFSVPVNWEIGLLEIIPNEKVEEVYGKIGGDLIGGGRPSFSSPVIKRADFCAYVHKAHERGFKFNYLLNSFCLGNMELQKKGRTKIRKILDSLALAKVDIITVSIPYLLEIIKKSYPEFKVHVSSMACVSSPIRAKFWEGLGADQITLPFMDDNINRDFGSLRKIRKAVKCRIQLIANCQCLNGCPFNKYHNTLNSHDSQANKVKNNLHSYYCIISCALLRFLEPWKFISSSWIRPEDAHIYDDIGIDSLKLLDRGMKTEYILRIAKAYTAERYEGNLLDLFPFNNNAYMNYKKGALEQALAGIVSKFKKKEYGFIPQPTEEDVYLNNRELDGFLEFFVRGNCSLGNCDECGYCKKIAEKALTISESYRQKVLSKSKNLLENIFAEGKNAR